MSSQVQLLKPVILATWEAKIMIESIKPDWAKSSQDPHLNQ
jgi:hypothetical protein